MTNARKYAGEGCAQISSPDPPEWIRTMSDRYVSTGTVRATDVAKFSGATTSGTTLLETTVAPVKNDSVEED